MNEWVPTQTQTIFRLHEFCVDAFDYLATEMGKGWGMRMGEYVN